MTPKEAIERISEYAMYCAYKMPQLVELQQAFRTAKEALQKQIAVEPIIDKGYFICPKCGKIRSMRNKTKCCGECGQVLKWG